MDYCVRPNYYRKGVLFRGTSYFNGGVWRDWVKVNWGDEGVLPNKIWGFIDLASGDTGKLSTVTYGGVSLTPSVYAIVESTNYENYGENEDPQSDMFRPIRTIVGGIANNKVTSLVFYLADVEAFVEPVAVVPDIGGPPNRYFAVKARAEWAADFELFLEDDHEEYNDEEEGGGTENNYQFFDGDTESDGDQEGEDQEEEDEEEQEA